MMRICVHCKRETEGNFCYRCGGKTVEVELKCPKCEQKLGVYDKFCPGCGKPVQDVVNKALEGEGRGGERV